MQPVGIAGPIEDERGLLHLDGWGNALTGYGTSNDRTMAVGFRAQRYGIASLREFWRGDDLQASFVEKPAKAMHRRGFEVLADGKCADDVEAVFEAAHLSAATQKAIEFMRSGGLGTVYLGFDDGLDPSQPAGEGARLLSAVAFDGMEVYAEASDWDENPCSVTYGQPRMWRASLINGRQLRIHPSRLLVFTGRVVSNWDRRHLRGGGEPPLARFVQHVADFDGAMRALLNAVAGLSQGVLKVRNLTGLLSRNNGEDLKTRLRAFALARSMAGVMPVDAELEDYVAVTHSIAGLPESIDRLMMRLSAAAEGMPVTILFGRSPAGLNATGDSDIRSYYDSLSGEQSEILGPQLLRVARHQARGRVVVIKFKPLWQPNEIEQSQLKYQQAQTDAIYVDMGANGAAVAQMRGYPVAPAQPTRTALVAASRPASLPASSPKLGIAASVPAGPAPHGVAMPREQVAA